MMREIDMEKQLKLLQQEIDSIQEELERIRLDQRTAIDKLRLDLEAVRRCLKKMHPDFEESFKSMREEIIQEVDPESL